MNKSELVDAVATTSGLNKADAGAAVEAVFATITDQMKSGGEVNVAGFGKFGVTERAAREGRNPLTGEKIQIKASKGASFKALKALKDALNG